MTKKSKLADYKDRFKVLEDYWADNRKLARESIEFASGKQWPENILKSRNDDGRLGD